MLDTGSQSQVAAVALLTGPGEPPMEQEVPRPFLTPAEARLGALRPKLPDAAGELAEPAPVPQPPTLPLPTLAPQRLLATARVDRRGRLRLDDAVAVLGWAPGARISCAVSGGEATLRRAGTGPLVLGSDGRVTLPRLTWYALAVGFGQRAVVETDDERDEVHVFSPRRLVRL